MTAVTRQRNKLNINADKGSYDTYYTINIVNSTKSSIKGNKTKE